MRSSIIAVFITIFLSVSSGKQLGAGEEIIGCEPRRFNMDLFNDPECTERSSGRQKMESRYLDAIDENGRCMPLGDGGIIARCSMDPEDKRKIHHVIAELYTDR